MENLTFDQQLISANFVGCQFAYLSQYRDVLGNRADYLLLCGYNHDNLYAKNKLGLENYHYDNLDLELERLKMIDSINESFKWGIGNNPKYTLKDFYKFLNNNTRVSVLGDNYFRGIVLKKSNIILVKDKSPKEGTAKFRQAIIKKDTGFKTIQSFKYERILGISTNNIKLNNEINNIPVFTLEQE